MDSVLNFIASPMGSTLVALLIVGLGGLGYLLWKRLDAADQYKMTVTDLKEIHDPLQKQKNYVRQLDKIIEDISAKTKSIKDEEIRSYWRDYVQELRVRQLKVLQEIHDKEYRRLQHGDITLLTDSDIHSRDAQVQRGMNWAANRSL